MSEDILIGGLKRKYAELAGELRIARKTVQTIKADMATIKGTLRLFAADDELAHVKPVQRRHRWYAPGQCTRTALDVLREATAPMTTREIALAVMERCGIEASTHALKTTGFAVLDALKRREGNLVASDGANPKRWRVAP
jgi:hypothetical protein